MAKVKLIIDGKEIQVSQEATILEAAQELGIKIPTLCHESRLKPAGVCRICVVEVEGARTLVAACHTPVAEGMCVSTNSPRVKRSRQVTLELLMTAHTGECVKDPNADSCKLHGLASDLEMPPPRVPLDNPRKFSPEASNPYILRDLSKCILCRRCVSVCRELAGQNLFGVAYRGFASKVVVGLDAALTAEVCKDCGLCVEVCPTGALSAGESLKAGAAKHTEAKPEPDASKRAELLNLLIAEQAEHGCLSGPFLQSAAAELGMAEADVFGVATFYSFLTTEKLGRHVIRLCKGVPCTMDDSHPVLEAVTAHLGVKPGGVTEDGRFSLEMTNCIGACDQAPAMLIDDQLYGNLTPDKVVSILDSFE